VSAVTAAPRDEALVRDPAAPLVRTGPILGAAIVAAGLSAIVVLQSDVLLRSGWFALFQAYNVLAFTGVGLLWLRRRPASGVGPILLLLAGLLTVVSLQGASSSLALSIGVLFDPVAALLAWYLILSYPWSRLDGAGRAVLSIGAAAVAVGFVPWFFLSSVISGATPLARCTAACPENALMLANRPDVAAHFGTTEEILRVVFAVAFVAVLVWRLVTASRPRRRVIAPVAAVGIVWIALFGVTGAARYLVVTDERVWDTLGWILTGTRVALPLAFALALVLAQVFAGGALETMMRRLRGWPGQAELQRAAADALADPGLRIGYRADDGGWRDASGERVAPPAPDSGKTWRELGATDAPDAVLVYDSALDDDPELLRAAASAIRLSAEATRLGRERTAILDQLRVSREQTATATIDERRRLERDLHDSAQQQLIALRIHLGLVNLRLGGVAELDVLGDELQAALDEIRDGARGVYPATLRDLGVGAALVEAGRTDPRVHVRPQPAARHHEALEAAVYFAALEAIQNASKHGGDHASIVVDLSEEDGELRFEVRDDGPGFEPRRALGSGIPGMRERLVAVGGRLEVDSSPGRGTRVRGVVPLPA
jgi:signal transduction histidine kinase